MELLSGEIVLIVERFFSSGSAPIPQGFISLDFRPQTMSWIKVDLLSVPSYWSEKRVKHLKRLSKVYHYICITTGLSLNMPFFP